MIAIGDDRIAVILALFDQVELVAALGTHFMFPEATLAVEGDAERVAVTQAPDLRRDRALVVKGVVARHAACVGEAYDLAQVCVPVLRGVELLALAAGNIEQAVGRDGEAMAVMAASHHLGLLAQNPLPASQAPDPPP